MLVVVVVVVADCRHCPYFLRAILSTKTCWFVHMGWRRLLVVVVVVVVVLVVVACYCRDWMMQALKCSQQHPVETNHYSGKQLYW